MRSRQPKVAHSVAGRAMVEHVLRAAAEAVAPSASDTPGASAEGASADTDDHSPRSVRYVLVVGHEQEQVRAALSWAPDQSPAGGTLSFVTQEPQLGTGHAVRTAQPALTAARPAPGLAPGTILVLYGDTPLVRAETLRALLDEHVRAESTLTFLTAICDDPAGYGRVVRDAAGQVMGIVEQRYATPEELTIREVNSGIYCFQADWLWARLDRLEPHSNGEYYLTDLVALAASEGRRIRTASASLDETRGVNDRVQLAEAERVLRQRILTELMLSGVTIEDPATTYVDADVRIGQDTVLRPGTMLRGKTVIGAGCEIGPNSLIRESVIGDSCRVLASWVEEAVMEPGARIGPMSHMRAGARLSSGANMGNFAEVKNATLGQNVQMHHFSYVGDASVGGGTNVAAGVITCNFEPDGKKYRTEIGENVFLGSDTMLVAPVTLGDGAQTAAGAVVTKDVPPARLAVGMPARILPRRTPPPAPPATTAPTASTTPSGSQPAMSPTPADGTSADFSSASGASGGDAAETGGAERE